MLGYAESFVAKLTEFAQTRNMLCMTYAVVFTITFLVYDTVIPKRDATEVVFGLSLSGLTVIFLSLTAFSDPGIFPKHTRPRVSRAGFDWRPLG